MAVPLAPPGTNNTVLTITSPTLPNGAVATAYSFTFAADGGLPPYSWSVASGVLPAGLKLDTGGSLTGTPTAAGQFAFTILVADSAQGPAAQSASKTFTLYWPGTLADGTQLPPGTYQARGALVFDGFRANPLATNAMGSELETFTVR